MMCIYVRFPVWLHYRPQNEFLASYFGDLHLGLEPRWIFYQHYLHGQLCIGNLWMNASNRVSVYNPLQIRAEIGYYCCPLKLRNASNIRPQCR